MGFFDGFPFVSKEERERRKRDFEKRLAPFGIEEQREKQKAMLKELFPDVDQTDLLFCFYDAKDAYTYKETKEEGERAARIKLRKPRWMDGRKETILLHLIELEVALTSLDDYPTKKEVMAGLFEE